LKIAQLRIGTQAMLAKVDGNAAYPLVLDSGEAWNDPLRIWLDRGRPDVTGDVIALSEACVLAPLRAPSKIVAVGLNYKDHAAEQKRELPKAPMLFSKAPSSIIGPNDAITFAQSASGQVDYENELAVVIGQTARNVSESDALDYVLGYMVGNDVSARDAQRSDGQFFRAKSFDTFFPIGPYIVTADEVPDPQNLSITTKVNGDVRQNGNTSDMVFSVAEIIAYASTYFTLEPGDIIATGTPAGVGEAKGLFLTNGDVVTCEIEHVGTLENRVTVTEG
jgi:2-keto-4-pentenoate hydratase/2-oxohepta-3-ene-1,7-dioic acid hydratase in catechol pathway